MSSESPIRVELYAPKYKAQWDDFVRQSKNGVFLFFRDYLEYHSDRFQDHSLMFFKSGRLVALMPANLNGNVLVSHGGLTFGGIISDGRMTTPLMLELFRALVDDLRGRGVRKLVYKAVPHIYHVLPAEEDLYALFVNNARLVRRDVSSTFVAGQRLPPARNRRRALDHARAHGVQMARSQEFTKFMAITDANLQERHGVRPVHTAAEMELLAGRFPENIKLFAVSLRDEMLGGVIIYESRNVAHGQYRNATEKGRELGALDFLMDSLLSGVYRDKPYFDFGISTVNEGRTLNVDLIRNKEGCGARATVYDFYELNLRA